MIRHEDVPWSTIKRTAVHLGGGGDGVPKGGVVDEGAKEGPTCPPRPTISLRQDLRHDDGGAVCREAQTWAPWDVYCSRGALLGAARLGASERLTAPVFCNKRNPCYTEKTTVIVVRRYQLKASFTFHSLASVKTLNVLCSR